MRVQQDEYQTIIVKQRKKKQSSCCTCFTFFNIILCCCVIILLFIGLSYFLYHKKESNNQSSSSSSDNIITPTFTTNGITNVTNLSFFSNTTNIIINNNNVNEYYKCPINTNHSGIIQTILGESYPVNHSIIISELNIANVITSIIPNTSDIYYAYNTTRGNIYEMVKSINLQSNEFVSYEQKEALEYTANNIPNTSSNVIFLDSYNTYKCKGTNEHTNEFIILLNSYDFDSLGITINDLISSSTSNGFIERVTDIKTSENCALVYTTYSEECEYINITPLSLDSLQYQGCSSISGMDGVFPLSDPSSVNDLTTNQYIIGRPSSSFFGKVVNITTNQNNNFTTLYLSTNTSNTHTIDKKSTEKCYPINVASILNEFAVFDVKLCFNGAFNPTLSWIIDPSNNKREIIFKTQGYIGVSISCNLEWGAEKSFDKEINILKTPKFKFEIPGEVPIFGEVYADISLSINFNADAEGSYSEEISYSSDLDSEFTYEFPDTFTTSFGNGPSLNTPPSTYHVGCSTTLDLFFNIQPHLTLDIFDINLNSQPGFSFSANSPDPSCPSGTNSQTLIVLQGGLNTISYDFNILDIPFIHPHYSGDIPNTNHMENLENSCMHIKYLTDLCYACDPTLNCPHEEGYCYCYNSPTEPFYGVSSPCNTGTICSTNDDCGTNSMCAVSNCCSPPKSECITICQ